MTMLVTTIFAAFVGPLTSRFLSGLKNPANSLGQKPLRQPQRLSRETPSPGGFGRAPLWMHYAASFLMLLTLVFNVIPFNYRALGAESLVLSAATAVAIFFAKWLFHRRQTAAGEQHDGTRLPLVLVTLSGLMIHSLSDGAALYSFGDLPETGFGLSWGPLLLMDRIAVGFFVWVLMWEISLPRDLERTRELLAWFAVTALCAATATGYFLMHYVVQLVSQPSFLGVIQSVLVGVIAALIFEKKP